MSWSEVLHWDTKSNTNGEAESHERFLFGSPADPEECYPLTLKANSHER
jgi:hypothetical protein